MTPFRFAVQEVEKVRCKEREVKRGRRNCEEMRGEGGETGMEK